MTKEPVQFDPRFLERQRQELIVLRDELRESTRAADSEQVALRIDANQQPHQFEDDAQKLDQLETDGELVTRNIARLEQIERALRKIDDGTYGYSEVSGHRIPEARLEAMPDAINTITEQQTVERI